MTENITLIPRMPWIANINTAWVFWVIKSQLHELFPACYACFDSFKINMTILYVCMDMHHMDTWSSEWSKHLRIPDLRKMESCDLHVSTANVSTFIQDQQERCITLPSLQLCVDYLGTIFIFLLFSSVHW